MRKALIVNTLDAGGGAEDMAMAMLDGFEALGTETWMAVGQKRGVHPRVVALDPRPARGPGPARALREARRTATRMAGIEDFDFPGSHRLLEAAGEPEPDVVVLGNLHGDYFDLRMLPRLSRRVPVVMRLADSWPFTGHCGTPLGCPRWEHGCGSCPDLTIPPAVQRDATRLNWHRKRSIFAGSRLFVVAPSQWQLDRARRSLLGPGIADSRVVLNGVDLHDFASDGPAADRDELGVPPDAFVLVFACNGGATNRYKDMGTLRAAMRRLASDPSGPAIELLVVGRAAPLERLGPRVRIRHLPYVESPARLAELYRCADLYVHATWEESFGLTAAEAMACGLPVVAAGSGGLAEVVGHGRTGLLAAPGDAAELARGIDGLLADPERRAAMGAAASADARERFDRRRMVQELHEYCAHAAREWAAAAGPGRSAVPR